MVKLIRIEVVGIVKMNYCIILVTGVMLFTDKEVFKVQIQKAFYVHDILI